MNEERKLKDEVTIDEEKDQIDQIEMSSDTKMTIPSGTYVHEFAKPFMWQNKKYQTLNFYFDNLSGQDMINVENEMNALGEVALAPEVSRGLQARIAAKAAKVGSDMIFAMPLKDFNKITNEARDFLL